MTRILLAVLAAAVLVLVGVKAEGARLRRVCAPNGPQGRWSS